MKKLIAILLALVLVFSLVACGAEGTTEDKPDKKDDASKAPETTGGEAADNGDKPQPRYLGLYDPEFDYTQYPSYKVGHINMLNDALTMEFDQCYVKWAEKLNMNYTPIYVVSSGSMDDFLSTLQTYCDQGYEGIVMSPDSTAYSRVIEVCNENEVNFYPHLGAARDYTGDGRLLAPMSGYDQYELGQQMADKLFQWKEEAYPDVSWDDTAFISVTWSIAPEVHIRCVEQEKLWADITGFGGYDESMTVNPKNFFIADAAAGNSDQTTIQNLTTQIMSANTGYKVWLIAAAVDYYAIGALNAVENLGLKDNVCIVSNGGSSLREYFDNGMDTAWRYAYAGASAIFTEAPINAIWAFCAGLATQETIYPDFVDPNDKGDVYKDGELVEEHNFAKFQQVCEWIDINNYKQYLEWSDLYLFGEDQGIYDYDVEVTLDMFDAYPTINF